jgi:hypothetical protein
LNSTDSASRIHHKSLMDNIAIYWRRDIDLNLVGKAGSRIIDKCSEFADSKVTIKESSSTIKGPCNQAYFTGLDWTNVIATYSRCAA